MSRELITKKLEESGLTVEWCLQQMKEIGEGKMVHPTQRDAIVSKIMNWHGLVDNQGFITPESKEMPRLTHEVQDAEYKDSTEPKELE